MISFALKTIKTVPKILPVNINLLITALLLISNSKPILTKSFQHVLFVHCTSSNNFICYCQMCFEIQLAFMLILIRSLNLSFIYGWKIFVAYKAMTVILVFSLFSCC